MGTEAETLLGRRSPSSFSASVAPPVGGRVIRPGPRGSQDRRGLTRGRRESDPESHCHPPERRQALMPYQLSQSPLTMLGTLRPSSPPSLSPISQDSFQTPSPLHPCFPSAYGFWRGSENPKPPSSKSCSPPREEGLCASSENLPLPNTSAFFVIGSTAPPM